MREDGGQKEAQRDIEKWRELLRRDESRESHKCNIRAIGLNLKFSCYYYIKKVLVYCLSLFSFIIWIEPKQFIYEFDESFYEKGDTHSILCKDLFYSRIPASFGIRAGKISVLNLQVYIYIDYVCKLWMQEGFFLFWMVEHDYYLRWKVLDAKSSKGEKLQANRTSFGQKDRQLQVLVHWAMES